jgi:hypothetical protein
MRPSTRTRSTMFRFLRPRNHGIGLAAHGAGRPPMASLFAPSRRAPRRCEPDVGAWCTSTKVPTSIPEWGSAVTIGTAVAQLTASMSPARQVGPNLSRSTAPAEGRPAAEQPHGDRRAPRTDVPSGASQVRGPRLVAGGLSSRRHDPQIGPWLLNGLRIDFNRADDGLRCRPARVRAGRVPTRRCRRGVWWLEWATADRGACLA